MMKRFFPFIALLFAAMAAFAQSPKSPTISIQNFSQPTPTSVEYDVVVGSDCEKYLYVYADTMMASLYQQMGFTLEQFLESLASYGIEWVPAQEGQSDHYAADDFEPNTEYVLYIYAKSTSGESTVVTRQFATTMGGGDGQAQLTMNLTYPESGQARLDISVNDQTAYYWYAALEDEFLSNFNLSIATATAQDYYSVMDQLVNAGGMSYYVHTSSMTEYFDADVNVAGGVQYVAVAFPFNAQSELGTYTEPIVFSVQGQGPNAIQRAASATLKVWPNPAVRQVSVQSESPILNIDVLDLQGRVVKTQSAHSAVETVDVAALPRGCYLLRVQTEQGSSYQQLLVE